MSAVQIRPPEPRYYGSKNPLLVGNSRPQDRPPRSHELQGGGAPHLDRDVAVGDHDLLDQVAEVVPRQDEVVREEEVSQGGLEPAQGRLGVEVTWRGPQRDAYSSLR